MPIASPPSSAVWNALARPAARVGSRVEFHPAIGSTNDRARLALRERGGDGLAVIADLQTAGRGRRGRSWESPPGRNLMVSFALRPRLPAGDAWWLAALASLAVRDAAHEWAELGVAWPNDLVAANGLKVAGLLIESASDAERVAEAVIGIGVNVNWRRSDMPAAIAARATSLGDLCGREVDRIDLYRRLCAALERELTAAEGGTSPLERYRDASVLAGRRVEVALERGIVAGRVAGIADDGSLLLDGDAGRLALADGEVLRVVPTTDERA